MFTLEDKKEALGAYINYLKKEIEKRSGNKPEEIGLKGGRYMSKGDAGDRGFASTSQEIKCALRDTSITSLTSLNTTLVSAEHEYQVTTPKDFVSPWSLVTVEYYIGETSFEKSFLIVPVEGGHDLGNEICSISMGTALAAALIGNNDYEIGEEIETTIGDRVVSGEIIDLV